VALRRTGCDVWQLECQANNVTTSGQSDRLLHRYMLPVFFATYQLHSPPHSAEIQPMLQQDASVTRPYCVFIFDTCTVATCPRRGKLPVEVRTVGLPQGLMNWDVLRRRSSTVAPAQCAGTLSCWKTNTSPAMLRITASSFYIRHTSR